VSAGLPALPRRLPGPPHPLQLTTAEGSGCSTTSRASGRRARWSCSAAATPSSAPTCRPHRLRQAAGPEHVAGPLGHPEGDPGGSPPRPRRAPRPSRSPSTAPAPRPTTGSEGIEGVFDATLPVCRDIVELGMRLQINTTVTGHVDELPDLLRQVLDLDAFLWSVFLLVPDRARRGAPGAPPRRSRTSCTGWSTSPTTSRSRPPRRRTSAGSSCSAGRRRRGSARDFGLGPTYRGCGGAGRAPLVERDLPTRVPRPPLDINAGRGFVFIDHIGNVHPSGFLPVPGGSVRERSAARDLPRRAAVPAAARPVSLLRGRCGVCEYRNVCGGSRSRAYAVTGDHLAEEPYCAYQPRRALGGPCRRG
jgi:AdoMet-dependent heme synthase